MTRREFTRATALIWATTLAAAAAVAVLPGAARAVRDAFDFRLGASDSGTWTEAISYFLANIRVVAAIFLAAWARARSGPLGLVLDAAVTLMILLNVAAVGSSVGAYGATALPFLVHLPLEWAALASGLGCYLAARSSSLCAGTCLSRVLAACALLAAAASVEVYVSG